jgi:hypothetical protein
VGQTLNDLVSQALSQDFSASTYKSVAQQAIRDALTLVAREIDMPSLQGTWTPTLVAGTADYPLVADDVRILSAFDADTRAPLTELSRESLDAQTTGRGRPWAYAIYNGVLTVSPTPDQTYPLTFRYSKDMAALTDSSDVSAYVPDGYLNMLVAFARHRLFRLEDDAQMSQFWRGEFDRDFARLRSDIQRGSRNRVRRVPGMFRRPRGVRFQRP